MWKRVIPLVLLASCGSADPSNPVDASSGDTQSADSPSGDTPPIDASADAPPIDASLDVTQPTDAPPVDAPTPDAPTDTTPADTAPPPDTSPIELCSRQLLPLSTARVSSQRPTLQFARAPGLRNTIVEVCRDRACRDVAISVDTPDDYVALTSNLAPGIYFWRLTPRNAEGATCQSATWQFTVPARSLATSRSWGASLDLNGDGFGDVAVASLDASGATGTVRVFAGSATGLSDAPVVELTGLTTQSGSYTAAPVPTPAGDLNGDGFADLAVGLPAALNGDGQVLVYLGSARGVSSRPDADLRSTEGHNGRFGAALAGVGDIEGDGYGDLVIGSPRAGATSATDANVAGRVYSFHGLPNGVRYTPTTTITGPMGPRGEFGAAVAGAGDVNSDRFPDLVVGAPGAGRAYVFRGTALGLIATPIATFDDAATAGFGAIVGTAGDLDGDNHADIFVAGNGADGRVVVRAAGSTGTFIVEPVTLATGGVVTAVASADTNADGFGDVVVGNGPMSRVTVYPGRAGALSPTPAQTVSLSAVAGLGASLASAGDVDRDGASELLAGGSASAFTLINHAAMAMTPSGRTLMLSGRVANVAGAWGGL